MSDSDGALSDSDGALSDSDEALSDSDGALSDSDGASSDSDEALSDGSGKRWVGSARAGAFTFLAFVAAVALTVAAYKPAEWLWDFPDSFLVRGMASPTDLAAALVFAVSCALACYLMARFLSGRGRQPLASPGVTLRELAFGVGIGAGQITADIAILAALGCFHFVAFETPMPLLVGALVMIGIACVEEGVFRVVLQERLTRHFGPWWALGLSSAVFGLVHLGNPNAGIVATTCIALVAGTSLGAVYMLTGRLWAPIGLHAAWNWAAGNVWGVPLSGLDMPSWIRSTLDGPEWLTGGAFGPEASVVELVIGGGIAVWLVLLVRKRGQIEVGGGVSDRSRRPAS